MNAIQYIPYEEVLKVYQKTIEKSGGGLQGIRDEGGIRATLQFVQHDDYYPSYADKLTYLVFRFCSGHFFDDGNKRIALTLGVYFLQSNKYYWEACTFMRHFEAFIYHIAASRIDQDLLRRIVQCFLDDIEYDEVLKLDIARAMSK